MNNYDEYNDFKSTILDILNDNIYAEDGNIYIKNKYKYDMYNFIKLMYPEYINELEKELEDVDDFKEFRDMI